MVEGPGCKLKGIKIKAKLKGQSVHSVRGNAVDKVGLKDNDQDNSGVAYVIPWPLFVNQECYIPKCLSRRAISENSSCEFFRSLFKVKVKGQRSTPKNKGVKFIIHDLWWAKREYLA